MIPFDRDFAARAAPGRSSTTCSSARSAPTHVAVGENFRFGHRAQGDADAAARRRALRDPRRAAAGGRRRGRLSSHIRGLVARRRGRVRRPSCSARRSRSTGEVVHGDKRGRELGLPDREPRSRRGLRRARATASTPARRRRRRRRAAAVNVGVRPQFETGRGELIEAYLHRLRRRPLRPASCSSSSSSGCAASGASRASRRSSSRWRATSRSARADLRPSAELLLPCCVA